MATYYKKKTHESEPIENDNARGLVCYIATRPNNGTWLYLGRTPQEVANSIKAELDSDQGLSASEIEPLIIQARVFTQHQIENMPEFPGW